MDRCHLLHVVSVRHEVLQMPLENRYYIKEAAKRIGVHPLTLKRWFKEGKVKDVPRDRRGWRVFSDEDIERIKKWANQIIETPEDEQQKFNF